MIIDLKKKDVFIIVFVALVLVSILGYIYYQKNSGSSGEIKKNRANTYTSSYITNDKQTAIYLSNYYNLINNDVEAAYKLLDVNIKENMDLNSFRGYISSRNFLSTKIQKFRVYNNNGYDYYDIYDENNNHIKFKTKGVMQYSVIIYY